MAQMLRINPSRLKLRIKAEGITFSKKLVECQFCEMKRNADENKSDSLLPTFDTKEDKLLPYLRFNSDENKFECSICSRLRVERNDMYRHIRAKHGNEIVTKSLPETVSENHQKCDGTICKKVYGPGHNGKRFWCKKCLNELKLAEETEVPCAECGKLFGAGSHMNKHIQAAHTPENQKKVCSLCSLEFSNRYRLYQHMKRVHEKVSMYSMWKLIFCKMYEQTYSNSS